MNRAAPSHTTPAVSRDRSGGRTRLALLILLVALTALGFSIWRTLHRAPARSDALRLDDNAALTPPPPLPSEDRERFRQQLESLQSAQNTLRQPEEGYAFARSAVTAGDPLTAYLALKALLPRLTAPEPRLLDALGRTQMMLGLLTETEQSYREFIHLSPASARGYLGLSRALAAQERRSEAAATLEQGAKAAAAQDIKARVDFVEEWEQRGELPRALQEAEALAKQSPDSPEITVALARLLFKMQRLSEAKERLQPLVARQPDYAPARTLLAGILASPLMPQRNMALAEAALLEAIQRNPADMASLTRLGQLYQEQGRHRQAVAIYLLFLKQYPDSPDARLQISLAYRRLGDTASAEEQNKIAQRLLARRLAESRLTVRRDQKPTDIGARLALARHYRAAGQFARALPEMQAAYLLSSRAPVVHAELIALYRQIGMAPPSEVEGKRR